MPPANSAGTCGYTPNRIQSVHGPKEQESYTGSSGLEVEQKADVRLIQRKGFIFVFLSPATYRAAAPSSLGRLLHLNCWSQRDRWFHSLPGMRDNASGVPWAWTHATSGLVSVSCWPDHPQDPLPGVLRTFLASPFLFLNASQTGVFRTRFLEYRIVQMSAVLLLTIYCIWQAISEGVHLTMGWAQ